jgi:hypothetical protein
VYKYLKNNRYIDTMTAATVNKVIKPQRPKHRHRMRIDIESVTKAMILRGEREGPLKRDAAGIVAGMEYGLIPNNRKSVNIGVNTYAFGSVHIDDQIFFLSACDILEGVAIASYNKIGEVGLLAHVNSPELAIEVLIKIQRTLNSDAIAIYGGSNSRNEELYYAIRGYYLSVIEAGESIKIIGHDTTLDTSQDPKQRSISMNTMTGKLFIPTNPVSQDVMEQINFMGTALLAPKVDASGRKLRNVNSTDLRQFYTLARRERMYF